MDIGEPERQVEVEPIEDPVPHEDPVPDEPVPAPVDPAHVG
jgi:hypothetical protein